jgi:hypothetical protein
MTFKRWLPTFLAFPAGGFLAMETVGSITEPASAAAAGLVAGAVVGGGQWLALRTRGVGRRWAAHTAAAMAAGLAAAAAVTGAGTEPAELMLTGLIAGAAVGAAQAPLLARGRIARAAWTAVTGVSWSLGWLVTSSVIVDAERGHAVFGSSGALLVTVLTGLALRRLAGTRAAAPAAGAAGPAPATARA